MMALPKIFEITKPLWIHFLERPSCEYGFRIKKKILKSLPLDGNAYKISIKRFNTTLHSGTATVQSRLKNKKIVIVCLEDKKDQSRFKNQMVYFKYVVNSNTNCLNIKRLMLIYRTIIRLSKISVLT